MAIHAVTREYTPGAFRNMRNLLRLCPCHKMRPDSPAFRAEDFHVRIKDVRNLDFPDGTEENPQELSHNKRRTLMSPQECKIDWCPQINLRWSTFPLHWIHSHLAFHIIYNKWLDILYNNPEIPWDTHLKSIGTWISVKKHDERPGQPISSGDESWFPVFEWRGKPSFPSTSGGFYP